MKLALLAGLGAAGAAWLVGSSLVGRWGLMARLAVGAVVEEGAKTGAAGLLMAPVAFTHLVFGAVEAAGELLGPGREGQGRRASAAALALVSHGTLGLVTEAIARVTESLIWGFTGAALVHLVWNLGVGVVSKRRHRQV